MSGVELAQRLLFGAGDVDESSVDIVPPEVAWGITESQMYSKLAEMSFDEATG